MKARPMIENGSTKWYQDNILHREDGPAIEWANGTKEWYLRGRLHREDGPAVEYNKGTKTWYSNGEIHREDGPAIESSDGGKYWFLFGSECTKEQHQHWRDKKNLNDNLQTTLKPKNIQKRSKI
ncbi:hypothetical protein [Duganella qianjiadongensis]|uniref:hypothetical protein n=1 Tax=Duganella qianjiadongensis TaxID=2692176 RepID=UPI001927E470|nr:hypothetical protein [Duganella qianjiadongensis]